MPEVYLKQPGFTYSACGPFANYKERIQKLKKNKKQEIQTIFPKMNLILQKILSMMGIKEN